MALYYAGGLLKHAKALCAICNPTTNSYKRLVPGYEAPVNLAYSARNRSAAVRIPTYSENPKAKRLEYRPPDPAANPYLAFAALVMAGLDGIQNKIKPGEPLDKNIYELPPEELKKVPNVAGSLSEALDCLEKDHAFLLKGDVFTEDFIDMWITYNTRSGGAVGTTARAKNPRRFCFRAQFDIKVGWRCCAAQNKPLRREIVLKRFSPEGPGQNHCNNSRCQFINSGARWFQSRDKSPSAERLAISVGSMPSLCAWASRRFSSSL
jgi:hypothetical protein